MPSQVLMDWEVCTIDWDSVTCLHMELRAGIFNDSRKMKVPGLLVGWFFALFSESSSIMRPPFFYHLTTLSLASRNMSCGVSSYSRSGFNGEGLGLQFQSTLRTPSCHTCNEVCAMQKQKDRVIIWRYPEKVWTVRNQQDPTAHESMRISFGCPLVI